MAMVDASLVLDAIVAVSIAAGALFAVVQLREMARDRRTELMLRFADIWLTPEFEENMSKLVRTKFSNGEEAERACPPAGLMFVGDYFETISQYVKYGLLDRDYVLHIYPVEWSWEKLKPWIVDMRSATGIEGMHGAFEWLAGEDRKMRIAEEQKAKAA
jgi:hypothetical protein